MIFVDILDPPALDSINQHLVPPTITDERTKVSENSSSQYQSNDKNLGLLEEYGDTDEITSVDKSEHGTEMNMQGSCSVVPEDSEKDVIETSDTSRDAQTHNSCTEHEIEMSFEELSKFKLKKYEENGDSNFATIPDNTSWISFVGSFAHVLEMLEDSKKLLHEINHSDVVNEKSLAVQIMSCEKSMRLGESIIKKNRSR